MWLGFGTLRLPKKDGRIDLVKTESMINEYMNGEFCYFDLHPSYLGGKAQKIIRELVVKRYPRNGFLLANKMPYYNIKDGSEYEGILEAELQECGVEYFDYYMLHCINEETYRIHNKCGGFEFLKRVKRTKKANKVGFSFHGGPELLDEILSKYSWIDFVQLQINFMDWNSPIICSKKNYEIARKWNVPILVMEAMKGGSLANEDVLSEKKMTSSELARKSMQFVATLDGVDIVLSGFSEVQHIIDNRISIEEKMNSKEFQELIAFGAMLKKDYNCTSCLYCRRECSKKIPIPEILSLVNSCSNIGKNDTTFRTRYLKYYRVLQEKGSVAKECEGCGRCEKICPQGVKIREGLQMASKLFEEVPNSLHYTNERNTQILIYLLKKHGINKIVASPGAMNMGFVYSVQQDDFFDVYSAPDERSAAYMACGMSVEIEKPVVLSCTGATASRNYLPALTEAFYRRIPLVAVTSTRPQSYVGHNIPQVIDRSSTANDVVRFSAQIPVVKDYDDEWNCEIKINNALLELKRNVGPVLLNLETTHSKDFSVRTLPKSRYIQRFFEGDEFPNIDNKKVAIFCGNHAKWSEKLANRVSAFCEKYNAIVLTDHTSNYRGEYAVLANIILSQDAGLSEYEKFDLVIHIGGISGAYLNIKSKETWRVSPDGELVDTYRNLQNVFQMDEVTFFDKMCQKKYEKDAAEENIEKWRDKRKTYINSLNDFPFSNIWMASASADKLPEGSSLHLGILNSLRAWNFFETPPSVDCYSNTGGFGIDGCVSTLVGASISNTNKLYYGVVGDLAFFYDMNVLGNRHVGSNIRLIVVNNGGGIEFKNYNHSQAMFGRETDPYMAAMGHYGDKSGTLLKNYANGLGFDYLCAENKEEYLAILPQIVDSKPRDKSLVVEVFTNENDESNALKMIRRINMSEQKSNVTACKKKGIPGHFKDKKFDNYVLWGMGECFWEFANIIKNNAKINFVCDNNPNNWGKEPISGVKCISPQQLCEMSNYMVIIMLKKLTTTMEVVNQLQDMGVNYFDTVYNWVEYFDKMN